MDVDPQKVIQQVHLEQQKRQQQEQIDTLVKVLSSTYDKAVAYTNVVIIAGYVAFFAIWNNTRETQSQLSLIATALLITFSCSVFVIWETYKMIVTAKHMSEFAKLIEEDKENFSENLQAAVKKEQLLRVSLARTWKLVLFLTITPAAAAVAILVSNLLYKLYLLGSLN